MARLPAIPDKLAGRNVPGSPESGAGVWVDESGLHACPGRHEVRGKPAFLCDGR